MFVCIICCFTSAPLSRPFIDYFISTMQRYWSFLKLSSVFLTRILLFVIYVKNKRNFIAPLYIFSLKILPI
nr:MAG TPA: hypothetical protein [Bacteriophage sp.]